MPSAERMGGMMWARDELDARRLRVVRRGGERALALYLELGSRAFRAGPVSFCGTVERCDVFPFCAAHAGAWGETERMAGR